MNQSGTITSEAERRGSAAPRPLPWRISSPTRSGDSAEFGGQRLDGDAEMREDRPDDQRSDRDLHQRVQKPQHAVRVPGSVVRLIRRPQS